MKHSIPVLVCIALGVGACSAGNLAQRMPLGAAETQIMNVDEVKNLLWKKEQAIYEGRSRGDLTYYVDNASPDFLAWTSGTVKPFRIDKLQADKRAMKGRGEEQLTQEFLDISLSGDTAILYYRNRRTRLPDGTPVDQSYDNIHVWKKTNNDWQVLASMSRYAEDLEKTD